MLARIVHKLHAIRDAQLLRIPPRAANPYLTHIPVLLSVARWRPIRRVLECGCGDISTNAFLTKRYFPELESLVSCENDMAWADRVKERFQNDARLKLHLVKGQVANAVAGMDLEQFDLVFIDDSLTPDERCATIRSVASQGPRRSLVVIHDFECLVYRQASAHFRHRFRLASINPNTGILWNCGRLSKELTWQLDQSVRNAGEQPSIDAWARVLGIGTTQRTSLLKSNNVSNS